MPLDNVALRKHLARRLLRNPGRFPASAVSIPGARGRTLESGSCEHSQNANLQKPPNTSGANASRNIEENSYTPRETCIHENQNKWNEFERNFPNSIRRRIRPLTQRPVSQNYRGNQARGTKSQSNRREVCDLVPRALKVEEIHSEKSRDGVGGLGEVQRWNPVNPFRWMCADGKSLEVLSKQAPARCRFGLG